MKTRTNQPVYGALGKKQVEDVKKIIQADKDILSQIVINEDEETLTLPKHIMPLRLTINSNEYFFDYDEMIIVNDVGEYIGDFSVNHDIVIISIDNDPFENPNVTQIDYILSDNGMEKLSTYYLYHPVTSAGTKLYVHELDLLDGDEETLSVKIISDNSSAYTSFAQLLADLRNEKAFVMNSQKVTYLSNDFYPTAIFADESSALITICCVKMSDLENTSLAVEDVDADNVIEL